MRHKWLSIIMVMLVMGIAGGCAKSTLDVLKGKVKKNPNDYSAHNDLAYHLSELGRFEEALQEYDKSLEIKPNDFLAKNNKGQVLYQMGRYKESLALFTELAKSTPRSDVFSNIAMNYHHMKQYDKALSYYEKAIQMSPKNKPAKDGLNYLMQDIKASGMTVEEIKKKAAENKEAGEAQAPAPATPPSEKKPE